MSLNDLSPRLSSLRVLSLRVSFLLSQSRGRGAQGPTCYLVANDSLRSWPPILACEGGVLLVPQSLLAKGGPYLFPNSRLRAGVRTVPPFLACEWGPSLVPHSSLASGGSYLFPNPRLRVGLLLVLRVLSVNVILSELSERALLSERVSSWVSLFGQHLSAY